jgi:hypothetical protein
MYQLRWEESVSRQLLQATAASDPDETDRILTAMADVEALLAEDPDIAGESRQPGTRLLIVPPLTVVFRVNARLREVLIIGVIVHGTKNQ